MATSAELIGTTAGTVPARSPRHRMPTPSPFAGFDLPYEDLPTEPVPLRCFRFPGGISDASRALVCVHGMAASGLSFARLRPLASRYDLRLLSAPVEPWEGGSRLGFSQAVEQVVRSLDRPVVLGTSFGSMVTLDLAHRAQDVIRGLILPAAFARNHAFPALLRPVEKLLVEIQALAAPLASVSARLVGGIGLDREAAQELARESAEVVPAERKRRLREVFETDLRALLREIDLPVLVIHGTKDHLVSKRDAFELAARLRTSRFEVIDGAGHVPYVSHPDELIALAEPFLSEMFSGD